MNPFEAEDARLITTAVRDATAQVEAEERIRQINVELERRVADRTMALTRSNDALRQFAWASSHDLQEPVRTVLAYSQWLGQHAAASLDEKATRMLQTIENNAEHMHGLLGALRQYIFISESTDEQWKPVDSNQALRTALFNVESLIEETGAKLEVENLPTLCSQEIVMVQVFQNLVGNALKYRSEMPPVIRIGAERKGEGWEFSVRDNGIGIDPKYHEYVFGVFKRLHGRGYSARASVSRFARSRSSGWVGGSGWSQNWGRAPAFDSFCRAYQGIDEHAAHARVSGGGQSGGRVVDRGVFARQSITSSVDQYSTAEDAVKALAHAGGAAEIPDLMLIDFNLPCGHGLSVLEAAARIPALAMVPKAILSSYLTEEEGERAGALGVRVVLQKPSGLDEFMREVGGAIQDLLRPAWSGN